MVVTHDKTPPLLLKSPTGETELSMKTPSIDYEAWPGEVNYSIQRMGAPHERWHTHLQISMTARGDQFFRTPGDACGPWALIKNCNTPMTVDHDNHPLLVI